MNKNKVLAILVILFVYFITTSFFSYLRYINELEKISVGYRSPVAQIIKTNAFSISKDKNNLKKFFEDTRINNYIIFDDSFNRTDLRGILFKGNVRFPRMIEGRFFIEADFFAGKKLAVLGENLLDYTYLRDGKRYISLFNEEYDVIGICGYGLNNIIDNMLFYNLDSIVIEQGLYCIDAFNVRVNNKIINIISTFGEVEIIKGENTGIKRLIGYEAYSGYVICGILLIMVILFLTKCHLFFQVIKKTLLTVKYIGFSYCQCVYITLNKWLLYEACGFISAFVLYCFLFLYTDIKVINRSFDYLLLFILLSVFLCSFVLYLFYVNFYYRKGLTKC